MFRTFVFRHLGELATYGVDGRADSVVQCRTAGTVILHHEVIVEAGEVNGVDRPFDNIVELKEVEYCCAGDFTLFFQKFVERTLDVVLNRTHGARRIKYEDEVRVIFFHVQFSFI